MKAISLFIVVFALLFSACDKKDPEPAPEPEAPVQQTGDLTLKITSYDTLGNPQSDHSGVKVLLGSATSATTAANGLITLKGLNYGVHAPNFLKTGYDSPPMGINVSAPSQTASVPLPRHSTYQLGGQQYLIVSRDSINMYFSLDKPVPQGAQLKVAVLSYTASNGTPANYNSMDLITVSSQTVTAYNIARLPNLKSALAALSTGAAFYVAALPASYGPYESSLFVKPVLLGESLQYPGNIQLIKNW